MGNELQHIATPQPDLGASQLRVIAALACGASISKAAEAGKVNRATVWRWREADPAFIAELNRLRHEQRDEIRGELRALAAEAVVELRTLVTNSDTPPAIKLRAIGMILNLSGAAQPESIGATTAAEVEGEISNRELLRALTCLG